jgi:hypothetical protein
MSAILIMQARSTSRRVIREQDTLAQAAMAATKITKGWFRS